MKADDMQKSLNDLASTIKAAVNEYLDATEHTHTPSIAVEFIATNTIGEKQFTPLVVVQGAMVGEA